MIQVNYIPWIRYTPLTVFRYIPTAHVHQQIITTSDWIVDWMAIVPVQLFISIRPLGHGRMEHLKIVEKEFVEICERHHKAPLSYVVSYERFPYPNIHMLIASSVTLDVRWLAAVFKFKYGPDAIDEKWQFMVNVDIQNIDVERKERATSYILKELNFNMDSDWDVRNLDYYLKQPVNRKDRKRQLRHRERLKHAKETST
jgi:hypothetical protein